jgi:hypothetical protein
MFTVYVLFSVQLVKFQNLHSAKDAFRLQADVTLTALFKSSVHELLGILYEVYL